MLTLSHVFTDGTARQVAYNATLGLHRRVVPNVVTVAAVLDAVPLEPSSAAALGATTKVMRNFESDIASVCSF